MVMRGVPGCAKYPLEVMRSRFQESELLAASSTWLTSLQETDGGKESVPQAAPTSGGECLGGLCMGTRRAQRGSLRLSLQRSSVFSDWKRLVPRLQQQTRRCSLFSVPFYHLQNGADGRMKWLIHVYS